MKEMRREIRTKGNVLVTRDGDENVITITFDEREGWQAVVVEYANNDGYYATVRPLKEPRDTYSEPPSYIASGETPEEAADNLVEKIKEARESGGVIVAARALRALASDDVDAQPVSVRIHT